MNLGTLWRTARYLKARQIAGRLHFKLHRPSVDLGPHPEPRPRAGTWRLPARRQPSLLEHGRLRLLNVERSLEESGWDDPSVDRLWRYNLHYFDDLNAFDSKGRTTQQRALIAKWLCDNPPGVGTGWEPYPTSLRIVNWIKWLMSGIQPAPELIASLAVQARWLMRRLETHLLGNHLFVNAKALVFVGAFFNGAEAENWLRRGVAVLQREVREQILPDGGQFERSPMYHALAFEDILDLLNLTSAFGVTGLVYLRPVLEDAGRRMLFWLRCMTHPDGALGLFNDGAAGVAPGLNELERYAAELAIVAKAPPLGEIAHLATSGYVRVAIGGAIALLDVAPIGPDYLPGHAHADTLSFELSLGGRRVLVNGGTSCYGNGERRRYERSTAAHNTVEVAGLDSSETWGSFRVGRRARPSKLEIDGFVISCSHDGYRFLPGRPEHRRRWQFANDSLIVEDSVLPNRYPAAARFALAPGLRLHDIGDAWSVAESTGRELATVKVEVGAASVVQALHAPEFGMLVPVDCLVVKLEGGAARTRWMWPSYAHSVSYG